MTRTLTITRGAPVNNPGKLYYMRTNAEYNANCLPGDEKPPSDPATFSTIGRGQTCWALLGDPEADLIYRLFNNSLLVGWSQGPGHVYRTDIAWIAWPVTSAVSLNVPGVPRLVVNVLQDYNNGWVLIESIRKALNYDWFDPDKWFWLGGMLGMNFDGYDTVGVGNRDYGFYMPLFDPSTFPGPAGRGEDADGMVINKALLHGLCPPDVQAKYVPQP